jgi:hypothetical protein
MPGTKQQQSKQPKQGKPQGKGGSSAKKGKKASRKSRNTRRRARRVGGKFSTESIRMERRELWFTQAVDAGNSTARKDFNIQSAPAWFKKFASMYEMYQLHHVDIEMVATSATTNSGSWVAGYNTNYTQRQAERTAETISAQYGSSAGKIYSNGRVRIPASALKGFKTNTPTHGDQDSWAFNWEAVFTGVNQQTAFNIYVTYNVTFRNPQINAD